MSGKMIEDKHCQVFSEKTLPESRAASFLLPEANIVFYDIRVMFTGIADKRSGSLLPFQLRSNTAPVQT